MSTRARLAEEQLGIRSPDIERVNRCRRRRESALRAHRRHASDRAGNGRRRNQISRIAGMRQRALVTDGAIPGEYCGIDGGMLQPRRERPCRIGNRRRFEFDEALGRKHRRLRHAIERRDHVARSASIQHATGAPAAIARLASCACASSGCADDAAPADECEPLDRRKANPQAGE